MLVFSCFFPFFVVWCPCLPVVGLTGLPAVSGFGVSPVASFSFRRLSSVLRAGGAPAPVSVVRSARCALKVWSSACLGVSFRGSLRSFTGAVAVVRFSSPAAAQWFAASWGLRFARSRGLSVGFCAVRAVPAAAGRPASWCVSVPVSPTAAAPVRGAFGPRVAAAVSRPGVWGV